MALLVLKRHVAIKGRRQKCIFLPAERAAHLWLVMNGEANATPKQRRFIELVDRIYLKRSQAPESYKEKYPDAEEPEPVAQQMRLPYKD